MKNFFTRLMAVILLAVLLVQGLPTAAQAADTKGKVTLKSSTGAASDNFDSKNADDGLWFPGDSITRIYNVHTVHTKATPLYFYVDITDSSELKDVLRMKVVVNGTEVFNGVLSDYTTQIVHDLGKRETDTEYAITLSLDTSIGNPFESKELTADFIWKYETDDGKTETLEPENPKMGDEFPLTLLIVIMVSSLTALICLFFLWKSRKEEEEE